ncbi:hypothetical protein I3843_06G129600 [Carya illinoinensis]|nr:hypothetical protein I3843_06G129600 [Carya illinoinensis]
MATDSSSPPPSDSQPVPATPSPPSPPASSPPLEESPPSPPPPTAATTPPPEDSVPSPPSPQNSNASPPPPSSSKTPSPPPPSNQGGGNNDSPTPPPPPPPPPPPSTPRTHNPSNHSPPPPHHLSPSSRTPSYNSNTSASKNGLSLQSTRVSIIIGVTVGAGLLLVVMILLYFSCTRKKKKQDQQYYPSQAPKGGGYYKDSRWNNGPEPNEHMIVNIPPAGSNGAWPTLPPPSTPLPHVIVSSDHSSNFSGPALPPPHPSLALGFSKSTFTYDELAVATGGFSQANLLGQGGFGYVHKGVLPNGKEIAVKSLKSGSGQGEREFQAEVEIISRVHHRHLVSLVGYCIAGSTRMLVYEYLPNKTFEFHLHGKDSPTLDWPTRLKIAMGSAKGLAYLHEDCHPRIIHRDIKGANILLDFSFEAKVADFGLAKLSQDNHTHVSTRIMGTFGYLAPEYASSGKLTEKSDVFSFGVMLLELITGRRPVDPSGDLEDSLVDWAIPLCARAMEEGNYDELVDPRLENNYAPHEMARMVACAATSIRHSAKRRPKMSQIVRALEGDVSLDDLNEGIKPAQSSNFSSSGSEYGANSYSTDMKKFKKMASASNEYGSSEYGATSDYGLNPSSSSSSYHSEEMVRIASRRQGHLANS